MKPTIPYWTTGGLVDLCDLQPTAFTAERLADALAKINRFNGRTPEPWSVASHSVFVAMLCRPQTRALGLLHDAHEAFLGDLASPSAELLAVFSPDAASTLTGVRRAKAALDHRLFGAWGVDPSDDEQAEVDHWDRVALQAEAVVFFDAYPRDADALSGLDRALDLICDLLPGSGWQAAKGRWLDFAHNLASIGQLRLPPAA